MDFSPASYPTYPAFIILDQRVTENEKLQGMQSPPLFLASIDAMRPVFMIVMGICLMIFAWRLAKTSSPWTGRLLMTGALMLAIGYSIVLPLYEAGRIERYAASAHGHGYSSSPIAMAWQVLKICLMNGGWLTFGIGVALHARILSTAPATATAPRPVTLPATQPAISRESVA